MRQTAHEALGVLREGSAQDVFTLRQDVGSVAEVDVVRREAGEATVAMLVVVPGEESAACS